MNLLNLHRVGWESLWRHCPSGECTVDGKDSVGSAQLPAKTLECPLEDRPGWEAVLMAAREESPKHKKWTRTWWLYNPAAGTVAASMFPREKLGINITSYQQMTDFFSNKYTFKQVASALHQLFSVEWDENRAPQRVRLFCVGQRKGISRHRHHVKPTRLSFPWPAENLNYSAAKFYNHLQKCVDLLDLKPQYQ